ncbi:putative exopolysaccharide biosynthesis related tyrosine-protein kinase [Methylocaldum marinum]|uniref:Putative exopolysaccharide biosynthesis related tyrosine-protein kinase n=1 Tax=Methylocaldum marinum TaxID=1432792 RepID=A0A250KPY2_9GAMM|nr:CpsD/CapB family tyrosine-protein kinase [Methylocaldum marinum]BBA33725.1 putative exopolysaccharide biosynthesis related tyrosine-protein kinase [Methylocaldum marinum]
MESISRALGQHHQDAVQASPQIPKGDLVSLESIQYTQTRSVTLSREQLRRQRIIAGYGPCAFVDAYKILRTRVLHQMREQGWNTLAITGPGAGCGKSLTAINLALSIALEVHQTVLLADVNLRDPAIHRYLGIEPIAGLSDHLMDNVPIQKILLNPRGIGRFVVLPGKRPIFNSSELIASPKMVQLVKELKHRYPSRFVVFDLPHLGTADALSFAPYVDAAILVVEEGKTTQDELSRAIASLDGIPLVGLVLNKAETGSVE